MHIFHSKQIISGTVVYTHPPSPPPKPTSPLTPPPPPNFTHPSRTPSRLPPTHARITCKTKQFIQGIGGYKCRFTLLFTYGAKRSRGVYVQKYVSPQPPPPHPPLKAHPPPTHTLPLPNNFPPTSHLLPPSLTHAFIKCTTMYPGGGGGGGVGGYQCRSTLLFTYGAKRSMSSPPPLRGIYLQKMVSPTIVITKTTIATTCYLAMLSY